MSGEEALSNRSGPDHQVDRRSDSGVESGGEDEGRSDRLLNGYEQCGCSTHSVDVGLARLGFLNSDEEELVLFADLNCCLVGYTDSWSGNSRPMRLVYSGDKILGHLVLVGGMSVESAEEHMMFNISGAYFGEATPVIVWSL